MRIVYGVTLAQCKESTELKFRIIMKTPVFSRKDENDYTATVGTGCKQSLLGESEANRDKLCVPATTFGGKAFQRV